MRDHERSKFYFDALGKWHKLFAIVREVNTSELTRNLWICIQKLLILLLPNLRGYPYPER